MVQTLDPGAASAMSTWMRSPAPTVKLSMGTEGAGTSSHHAEYEAFPWASTSCSVPAWISVPSVTRQSAVTQPPPMPTQEEEYSSSPALWELAVGTTQSPATCEKSFPPCSAAPWL